MRAVSAAVLSCVLFCGSMFAQAPAAPPQTEADFRGAVVGFMHAIHATNNLDTTAAFYKEVFGLSSPVRPFAADGPRVLTNIVDCDVEQIACGQSVQVVFHPTKDGPALPRFRPV